MNAVAFGKVNPFGARINAIFSSDVGHFDVPDMRMVLPEAYELVEDGLITADDFRDFTFANAVRLWGTQNPDFFEGTADRPPGRRGVGPHSGARRGGVTPNQQSDAPQCRARRQRAAGSASVLCPLPCPIGMRPQKQYGVTHVVGNARGENGAGARTLISAPTRAFVLLIVRRPRSLVHSWGVLSPPNGTTY